jgi:two-component system response regulator PilR (NtrC family)
MSALPEDAIDHPRPEPRPRVLVADDERSMRELLAIVLRREGYDVVVAESGQQAIDALERQPIDMVISDLRMPDMSGVDVLRAAKQVDPEMVAIVVTAFASTETAVEALRLGACDYLTKPFDVDELKILVRHTLERRQLRQENVLLKRALGQAHSFANIIGGSPKMLAVFRMIETIAPTTSTVLVTGESGTGKELAARAIHFMSLRRDRPFVALNCGALPETLLESELFGHMRGAFTGAATNKKGLLETAHQGTVFLDEISEMSPMMQVKLLRVLQDRRFRRLGGTEEIQADIRIIAATNRDLSRDIADGRFREDLFYRINVIPLHLPPLRERGDDISMLAGHFVARFAEQMGKRVTGIAGETLEIMGRYPWPGNIRELENAMERAVALEPSPAVLPDSLPDCVRHGHRPALSLVQATAVPEAIAPDRLPDSDFSLEAHLAQIERDLIARALQQADGARMRAAELLGMSFRSFRYLAKKHNL